MTDGTVCKKIRKLLNSQFRRAFGGDLEINITQRNCELWLVGIDTKKRQFVDICGNIDVEHLVAINAKGFIDADAGYRADLHNAIDLKGAKADIFLINSRHYNARPDYIEPIIVHELAHLLEQTGQLAQPKYNDDVNANAILKSLQPNILNPEFRHNEQWALHLAIGARTTLSKGLTTHKTIRSYLEAAIPHYDRQDGIKAMKGWP